MTDHGDRVSLSFEAPLIGWNLTFPPADAWMAYWYLLGLLVLARLILLWRPIWKLKVRFFPHIKTMVSLVWDLKKTMNLEGFYTLILRELFTLLSPMIVGLLFRIFVGRPELSGWDSSQMIVFLVGMGLWCFVDISRIMRTRNGLKAILESRYTNPKLINRGLSALGWTRKTLETLSGNPVDVDEEVARGNLLSRLSAKMGRLGKNAATMAKDGMDHAVNDVIKGSMKKAWRFFVVDLVMSLWPIVLMLALVRLG